MATRQRKVERRRLKRKQKRRMTQVLALRSERRLTSDAHPLHACMVNRCWEEDGMASILVARRTGPGRVTMAAFLVDRLAMGLKDAWGRVDLSVSELDEVISGFNARLEMSSLNLGTAKHLVYGGIELAKKLGFRLPRRYERWTAILGPLPEGETPDMSLFLDDGRIHLLCSQRDLEARLIGTTPEKFLARPDVDYILGEGGFTLVDDEEDESDDHLAQLEHAMIDSTRQWCFANGQTPHPLLADVVGAFVESVAQAIPPELGSEDDVDSLSEEQRDKMMSQVSAFVSASFHEDQAGLGRAAAQFRGFMNSVSSLQELIDALGLAD